VEGAFDWLPAVLRERAGRAGVPASTVKWSGDEGVDEMIEAGQVLLYTIGAFGEPSKRLRFSTAPAREGKPRLSPEQWVNKILAALPIYSRYTFEKDAFSLASVPLLTSVQRCVAYSLVLVWTDRHDFADLVRPCGYLVEDSPNSLAHHYFLADDARQRFCTPAHSNAQRQREWRRNQKEGAK
jgi:hypothetical protein